VTAIDRTKIAIEPKQFEPYVAAAEAAGACVVPMSENVGALIWTDYARPDLLEELLEQNPQLEWVQLPFAGVDAFAKVLKHPPLYANGGRFTSAKGSYREPVAEHALMLCMALGRAIPERVRATNWGKKFAVSLYDANIVVVGGGGITEEFLKLAAPFRSRVTVVRKNVAPISGADSVVPFEQLDEVLPDADFVVLAAALTDETRHLFDARRIAHMKSSAYLVNVARGPMVVTADLIAALNSGTIAGAGVDVTDPEPLPDGHALWSAKNIIITPHTADTNPMVLRMFAVRIGENVRAYQGRGSWVGLVDPDLGY
jgi:phosphoglycerate dehydrogenase-like enzyme